MEYNRGYTEEQLEEIFRQTEKLFSKERIQCQFCNWAGPQSKLEKEKVYDGGPQGYGIGHRGYCPRCGSYVIGYFT